MQNLGVVSIVQGDAILKNFGNQLGALGQGEAHKALARAVNRVTNTVHGRVIRAVAKQSSIPVAIVRRQVYKSLVRPGSGDVLEGKIKAIGTYLPLSVFNPKQFSWGVRVKVWGTTQRYPGLFIYAGRWNSGNAIAGYNVFENTRGLSRSGRHNAIKKEYGPSVPEELISKESARIFEQTVQVMLPARVAHEIGRILPH